MRQHGTLATAVIVVLLSGIVSAGAMSGTLSLRKSDDPGTLSLEMLDDGTGSNVAVEGQPGRRQRFRRPTALRPPPAPRSVRRFPPVTRPVRLPGDGLRRRYCRGAGRRLRGHPRFGAGHRRHVGPDRSDLQRPRARRPRSRRAPEEGAGGLILDISKLLNSLPVFGLLFIGQLLKAVPANQLPLVGSLLTSVGSGNVTQIAGLLKGLPVGGLPVVGQLLQTLPVSNLPVLGQLLSSGFRPTAWRRSPVCSARSPRTSSSHWEASSRVSPSVISPSWGSCSLPAAAACSAPVGCWAAAKVCSAASSAVSSTRSRTCCTPSVCRRRGSPSSTGCSAP